MSVYKCKMCGGELDISNGVTVAECEYCGTKQTLPRTGEDAIRNLFNRANTLRLKCDFDKAEQLYEKILQENSAEPEAHWGIVLCKYGIEYVEDPKSFKRIPTCHRTSYDAVTADPDYLAAVENADLIQRGIYEAEAKTIDEIQRGILTIAKEEKTFDVFICYKETDENGKRTVDSAIANDIYYQLTQEGLKVFYAAITLEDKLGQEYEPYIFAALNSAKVMLVIGTKPEYFTAVWVKNEWSRFLKLMKTNRSKLLIPCYKDMDAYELPEEFSHLQAQDMAKIGFINDVVRGIKKITAKETPKPTVVKETILTGGKTNVDPLLERAFIFLEDGEWDSANEYCEKVLDMEPKNARAYLGKLMVELQVRKQESLKDQAEPFDSNNNYQKAVRFADADLQAALTGYIEYINTRNENARREIIYINAKKLLETAQKSEDCHKAADEFKKIPGYKDADELLTHSLALSETLYKELVYAQASLLMQDATTPKAYEKAIEEFKKIPDYKDAEKKIALCQAQRENLEAQYARKKERRKKRNTIIAIVLLISIVLHFAGYFSVNVFIPDYKYSKAMKLMEAEKYQDAISAFEKLDGYKDSATKIAECETAILDGKYAAAVALMNGKQYTEAIAAFGALNGYKDSTAKIQECETAILDEKYAAALALMNGKQYTEAIAAFSALNGYRDSADKSKECAAIISELDRNYNAAVALMNGKNYADAITAFAALDGYKDSTAKIQECETAILDGKYNAALALMNGKNYAEAITAFAALDGYKDSASKIAECEAIILELDKAYNAALALMNNEKYAEAITAFEALDGYKDSTKKIKECEVVILGLDGAYDAAVALMNDKKYAEAIVAFEVLNGYKDSGDKIKECEAALLEENYNAAVTLMNNKQYAEALAVLETLNGYKDSATKIQECEAALSEEGRYAAAVALMNEKKYEEAIAVFAALDGYKDSATKIKECAYRQAEGFADEKQFMKAIVLYTQAGDYADAKEQANKLREKIAVRNTFSAGEPHVVCLLPDGVFYGVNDWSGVEWTSADIIAVSAGYQYTVGLKADGTVVTAGYASNFEYDYGQRNVSGWTDIIAISAGFYHTVGLRRDGTVVAVGDNEYGQCNVSDWTDIVAISAGDYHTVGLKADGTVVDTAGTGEVFGDVMVGKHDVSNWTDIVAVSAGTWHTVGLRADGTVVATGKSIYDYGECDVSDWTDIVAVGAGYLFTVGLKADGTVIAIGNNNWGGCNVSDWKDIVAISVGPEQTAGLQADGRVVETNNYGWNYVLHAE